MQCYPTATLSWEKYIPITSNFIVFIIYFLTYSHIFELKMWLIPAALFITLYIGSATPNKNFENSTIKIIMIAVLLLQKYMKNSEDTTTL